MDRANARYGAIRARRWGAISISRREETFAYVGSMVVFAVGTYDRRILVSAGKDFLCFARSL